MAAVPDPDAPFDACPDGGRCWHYCPLVGGKGIPCWRVSTCVPLTAHGADWTAAEKAAHA